MAMTVERVADPSAGRNGAEKNNAENNGGQKTWAKIDFVPPDLGRSVQIVGPVVPVDPNEGPHPKNSRGELGKALFNYYRNSISKDPLSRVSANTHSADKRNVLSENLNKAPKGEINPDHVEVTDPEVMSRHIKRVAYYLGADAIGIAQAHPTMMYGGRRYSEDGTTTVESSEQEGPEELCRRYPYLIVATTAWDYDKLQAHRHFIGDAAYHVSQMRSNVILKALEAYIRELGYTALRATANPQAAALAAGMGELGRNGMVISEKFGARVHMPNAIQTDLPLAPGHPIDLGVTDFCNICRKCAITCPTNSISFGDRVEFNGALKYKINWLTCYKLRPYTHDNWGSCLTCVAVCPFTKPNTWWRTLAIKSLTTPPVALRPYVVRALKAIDDRFWGVMKQKRVRWMGYDSGVKPGEHACTVAGCTAQHDEAASKVEGDVGYYAPLKENTNRFVRRDV